MRHPELDRPNSRLADDEVGAACLEIRKLRDDESGSAKGHLFSTSSG